MIFAPFLFLFGFLSLFISLRLHVYNLAVKFIKSFVALIVLICPNEQYWVATQLLDCDSFAAQDFILCCKPNIQTNVGYSQN